MTIPLNKLIPAHFKLRSLALCGLLLLTSVFSACGGSSSGGAGASSSSSSSSGGSPNLDKLPGSGGSVSGSSVTVFKSSGEIQCEYSGHLPQEAATELTENGIDVIEYSCGYITGISNLAVCGGGTSSVNVFRIHSVNLDAAVSLGFASEGSLNKSNGMSLELEACR